MHKSCIDISCPIVSVFLLVLSAPSAAQLSVPEFDPERDDVIASSPLVGYRTLSGDSIMRVHDRQWHGSALPTYVFVGSAKDSPWVSETLISSGGDPETAGFEDWYRAACNTSDPRVFDSRRPNVKLISDGSFGSAYVDVDFVAWLPRTELLDCNTPKTFTLDTNSGSVEMLGLTDRFGTDFYWSYAWLGQNPTDPGAAYSNVRDVDEYMRTTPHLASIATFQDGLATFGVPTVYNSNDAKLDVPTSIKKEYDVYAVYFAVSFRDLNPNDFSTFSFGVTPQDESIALDLIPLRFDEEAKVTETSSLPHVKIGSIEIGSPYQRQVVFSVLKPKVRAFGLQEREFSWSVIDDAMQLGSMRFVAILGVPHGFAELPVLQYATATYKESWLAQGSTISTKPVPTVLSLGPEQSDGEQPKAQ